MRLGPRALVILALAGLLPALPASPAVAQEGTHSPNMAHVANLPYPSIPGRNAIVNGGTDIEFVTMTFGGSRHPVTREFALAGSYDNGLQIVDITDPENATIVARYDCAIRQGDVQVFKRGNRTLVTYTQDDPYNGRPQHDLSSQCYQEAAALGLFGPGVNPAGTFIVDISRPAEPRTVSFLSEPRGSHNQTVAPGGRYLYNSNSDLGTRNFQIEVWDIANLSNPQRVYVLNTETGLSSHDITFSEDGTRAYSAAITHTLVLDTTDLARPRIIGRIIDPAVNIHHQSDPVTLTDSTTGQQRTFLVVTDEIAGAAGNAVCPGGGLHVYDITGDLERTPVKVGVWNMPEVQLTTDTLTCTSHVLRMYPEHGLMTIAWYAAGVRVVDISGLVGVSLGVDEGIGNVGVGMKEIGYYYFPNSDTWSVKTNKIEADGSFYLYGNDLRRGMDVYRFSASAAPAADGGTWLSAGQAAAQVPAASALGAATGPYCLYRGLEAA
jgi:hypothetical protein